jgi:hypothetical protein
MQGQRKVSTANENRQTKKLQTTAGNLQAVAAEAIRTGRSDETTPMTQELRVLSRLCAARGQQIPIYQVQHAPAPSMSFISEVGRRKTELNHAWGYDVRQEFQNGHSVWWIVCGPDGMPTVDRSVRKKPAAQAETSPGNKPAGWRGQSFTFGSAEKPEQQNIFRNLDDVRNFCSYEMGGKK